MKRLILARHAKSSWNSAALADIERPLNNRGLKNAPVMAKHLGAMGLSVDLILSSPANRAYSTAEYYADELLPAKGALQTDDAIYLASQNDLFDIISNVNDEVSHLMVVGHNPGMTSFASVLSQQFIDNIPTCGVVVIDLEIDRWSQIKNTRGKLQYFEYPKKISG